MNKTFNFNIDFSISKHEEEVGLTPKQLDYLLDKLVTEIRMKIASVALAATSPVILAINTKLEIIAKDCSKDPAIEKICASFRPEFEAYKKQQETDT